MNIEIIIIYCFVYSQFKSGDNYLNLTKHLIYCCLLKCIINGSYWTTGEANNKNSIINEQVINYDYTYLYYYNCI